MRRAFAGGVVLLGLSGIAAADEPVGRFQMLLLNPDVNPARVMILDTRDGHLWQWWETAQTEGKPDTGGNGVIYMGKMTPGTIMGETRAFRRFFPVERK